MEFPLSRDEIVVHEPTFLTGRSTSAFNSLGAGVAKLDLEVRCVDGSHRKFPLTQARRATPQECVAFERDEKRAR
jgi:hypothetical protein